MSRETKLINRRNQGRRLNVVDVENLVGCARPSRPDVEACSRIFSAAVGLKPEDHTVVACNHGAAVAVVFGWPASRLLRRSGSDGADLALLDVLDHERVAERFGEVVIASGDGIFADTVARLTGSGLKVTVVSRARSLSRKLELASPNIVLLDSYRDPEPPSTLALLAA